VGAALAPGGRRRRRRRGTRRRRGRRATPVDTVALAVVAAAVDRWEPAATDSTVPGAPSEVGLAASLPSPLSGRASRLSAVAPPFTPLSRSPAPRADVSPLIPSPRSPRSASGPRRSDFAFSSIGFVVCSPLESCGVEEASTRPVGIDGGFSLSCRSAGSSGCEQQWGEPCLRGDRAVLDAAEGLLSSLRGSPEEDPPSPLCHSCYWSPAATSAGLLRPGCSACSLSVGQETRAGRAAMPVTTDHVLGFEGCVHAADVGGPALGGGSEPLVGDVAAGVACSHASQQMTTTSPSLHVEVCASGSPGIGGQVVTAIENLHSPSSPLAEDVRTLTVLLR
jgi:hypothetical protein